MSPCRILLALLLASTVAPAAAQPQRIDDSGSRVLGGALTRMRWDELPGHGTPTVSGQTSVQVRLDVAPWQGRQGRIYMTLAPQPMGRVDVSWTSRGPLLPGRLRDGERTLVYAGPISVPVIEDIQQLEIRAEGARLLRPEQLEFSFEMEEVELP